MINILFFFIFFFIQKNIFSHEKEKNITKKCVIFVHGLESSSRSEYDYQANYSYWRGDGSVFNGGLQNRTGIPFINQNDAIKTITSYKDKTYHDFYVVSYDGTQIYYNVAHRVASEIKNAILGEKDKGGNQCSEKNNQKVIIVAHSMGATIMDFILGNTDESDPFFSELFSFVGEHVLRVESLTGAHRGSKIALLACGQTSSDFFNKLSHIFYICNEAMLGLLPNDSKEVVNQIGSIQNPFFLHGGSGQLPTSFILSGWSKKGKDDGILSFASQFGLIGNALKLVDEKGVSDHFSPYFVNTSFSNENHNNIRRGIDKQPPHALNKGIICNAESKNQVEEINCFLNKE